MSSSLRAASLRRGAARPLALLILGAGLGLTACGPVVQSQGLQIREHELARIQRGISTERDVRNVLGSPTTTDVVTLLNDTGEMPPVEAQRWIYIHQVSEQHAFFAPEVVERSVLVVDFDAATGVVHDYEQLGLEDGYLVEIVPRETPTEGIELTILQQLLGNLGRFTPTE